MWSLAYEDLYVFQHIVPRACVLGPCDRVLFAALQTGYGHSARGQMPVPGA
jgi:hypothetical protein